jgi:hypothetical protein
VPAFGERHRASVPDLGDVRGWHLEASNRLSPGGAWPDPTGWVWPPAILNVTVPPGLIATRAGLPLVGGGAVDLLAALGLAEGAAEEREAGGTDVKQWQPRWRIVPGGSRVDGIYGLASDDVCGCRLPAREGPTPEGVVGPRTWQMTRTASMTR